MIAQEQTQQMEQVASGVVDRRRGYQQHAAADDQSGECSIPIGFRITEAVRLVDDNKAAWGGKGRQRATLHTQRLVRDDGRLRHAESIQQRAPLLNEHGRNNERERFLGRECDCERDVGFAKPHLVRKQRAAISRDDRRQSLGGRYLVWGEPGRPRPTWSRRFNVEQRTCRSCYNLPCGRLAARLKEGGERLRDWNEILRQDPRPARDGRYHRG